MNSPITGKPMKLVKEPGVKLEFRKEDFEITYHYYLCKESKEQFTNDELDRINQTQVHNQYRERYGIPFPEEIRDIREKYGISASKMSDILGFGANSYRLYESGEIPSVANGRLILAVRHPKDFIKQVEASAHLLSKKDQTTLIEHASGLIDEQKKKTWDILFRQHVFMNDKANQFSGYKEPSLTKIASIISYFSTGRLELFKTKLNKLLFYADFGYFKQAGFSMTGISYRAIQLGPVPAQYDKLYDKMSDDQLIRIDQVLFDNGNYGEAVKGLVGFEKELFNKEELSVLKMVADKFKNLNSSMLVNLSHQEKAWIDNQKAHELISYQKYAFELKNLD
jgi:putative zinc finger/helix-turn-helix YgiT family protein